MRKRTVLLSKKRDSDLIALKNTIGSRDFTRLLKESLRAIVRADHANSFRLPDNTDLGRTESEVVKDARFEVAFGEKDADVAALLEHVKPGKFNAFVKNAIRMYIGTLLLSAYMDESFAEAPKNAQTVRVVFLGEPTKQKSKSAGKKKSTRTVRKPRRETQMPPVPSFQSAPSFSAPIAPVPAFTEELDNIPPSVNDEDDVLALLGGLID